MSSLTKQAIKQSFWELLEQRPLAQITVKDIVERCGINRNSFYYHFQDIPALIEEIVVEEADRIISQYPSIDSVEICINACLDFAKENRRAILHIYNSVNRAMYEQYLWQVCESVVSAYVGTVLGPGQIAPEDRTLIQRYYKCLCFGIATEWIGTGMREDISAPVHRLCELKKGAMEQMIRRSRETV